MKSLAPDTLANLAVTVGDSTPVPSGGAGSLIWSTTAGTPLVWDGTNWVRCYSGGGSGDVVGPASAIDNRIARFDLATGKLIQSSLAGVDDAGSITVFDGTTGNARAKLSNGLSGLGGGLTLVSPDETKTFEFLKGNTGTTFNEGGDLSLAPAGQIGFYAGSSLRMWSNTSGNWNILAPSSGTALAVAGETSTTTLKLPAQSSDPTTPASGNGLLYAKAWAGRTVPNWLGPNGVSYALSPHFGENNIRCWKGAFSTTATTFASQVGTMPYTGASPSAPTIPALASTNRLTQTRRSTISTGAAAGGLAYIRANQTEVWRGNAAGQGGFLVVHRFALSGTLQSGLRAFAGLVDVTANPSNVDPTTTTTPGGIGLACAANSGNWKLINNVTGTARTSTDLGANFSVNNTDLLEIALWCAPNGSGITYQVTNLSTGNSSTGTVTTNIPANTTFLAPSVWVTNNATAAAQTLDFVSTYVESDY